MSTNKLLKNILYGIALIAVAGLVVLGTIAMNTKANNMLNQGKTNLAADAFMGKVLDREGIASLKPVLNDRWSVAETNMHLETGDLVMTGTRGANALKLQLSNGVQAILGPGTLLEVISPTNIKLMRGELEINAPAKITVIVNGFKQASLEVTGTKVIRSQDDKLTILTENPAWLRGYKNDQSTEALGSLLANVDGRNEPLTIGYHKVTVDIRDQIARTEVEESFINTTDHVLEGVFYFPLPADASISGFAMWIGDEMVQAEIVEKQRAREIYETILRERRDPGLLEWTGGNIFKARVFPISSEKRIKISYTQVLPKIGSSYRYNYALQSELLRLHPLKKLQIDVKVSSVEPLAKVESSSHACRIDQTKRAAHIEFDAEEYTPKQDFELDITTAPTPNNIGLITHQRGDDGYFMLLVNAPQENSNSLRRLIPNSAPTNFMIMADTSGSMAGPQRDKQISFIEAMLSSLGAQDSFNLMTCDVTTQTAFPQAVPNTLENREKALQFLEKRYALGWSDLEKAFATVMAQLEPQTQVIYVGDGIITTGNADPVAFSQQLPTLYQGKGSFHAVAPGSSYEAAVLRSIASLGGGSVRTMGGGTDPAQTAFDLLKEISTPAVKDLQVNFTGIDVAASYPERLPNLPLGSQQVIVGRYNPQAGNKNAAAKVVVSGLLNGQKVEYTQDISLDSTDTGNSFIPRLWAREHLEHLLAEGTTAEVKDKIITLSEDFQIITPYTSFLVLESDADRERFQVKKRFRMRDGEEFFTKGRDNATFELARKQMIKARRYRTELRGQILANLLDLNRSITPQLLAQVVPQSLPVGGAFGGVSGGITSTTTVDEFRAEGKAYPVELEAAASLRTPEKTANAFHGDPSGNEVDDRKDASNYKEDAAKSPADGPVEAGDKLSMDDDVVAMKEEVADQEDRPKSVPEQKVPNTFAAQKVAELPINARNFMDFSIDSGSALKKGLVGGKAYYNDELGRRNIAYSNNYNFEALFPAVAPPVDRTIKSDWLPDILKLAQTLDRRDLILSSEDGYQIRVESQYTDTRNRVTNSQGEYLLAKNEWVTTDIHVPGNDFAINWFNSNERGVFNVGWLLGRSRPPVKGDEASWSEPFSWYFGDRLKSYLSYTPELQKLAGDKVAIILHNPSNTDYKVMLIIDLTKSILLEERSLTNDKVTYTTIYSNFIEIGGAWWPQTITTQDMEGRKTNITSVVIKKLPLAEFMGLTAQRLASRKDAIILTQEIEKVEQAKQDIKDQRRQLADYWRLLNYFAASQQWDKVDLQLQGMAQLTASKRGFNLIQVAVLQARRQNEQLKELLLKLATKLAKTPVEADYSIANQLLNYTNSLNQGNEKLALVDSLKPVYQRQKHIVEVMQQWDQYVIYALQSMDRPEELFAKQRQMAQDYPFNYTVQTNYANALASRGEIDAATKYLAEIELKNAPWQDYELQQLRSTSGNILFNAYRLSEFVSYIEAWDAKGVVDQYVLSQYLSALIMLDQEAKANQLIKSWLTSNRKENLKPNENNRLGAAIQQALGQGYNLYTQRIEPEYLPLLVETARYFANHPTPNNYPVQILQNYSFNRTDMGRALQQELYQRLQTEQGRMSAERLQQFFAWLKPYSFTPAEGEAGWQKILDNIYARWQQENNEKNRAILASLITSYGRNELKLTYYRKIFALAHTPEEKISATYPLFYALLAEKWSADIEKELLQLLPYFEPSLGEDQLSTDRHLDALIVAFHNFATWVVEARTTATVAALPNVNLTTRRELNAAKEQALKDARLAALQLFTSVEKEFKPAALRPWLTIERLYLEVKLKSDPEKIRLNALALVTPLIYNSSNTKNILMRDKLLASRGMATLLYLATQKESKPENIDQLLNIMDQAIKEQNGLLDWKAVKYQLLVALDRGDALEAALKEWFGAQNEFAKIRWGRSYGYILAERNQIKEAIKVFEQIQKVDELYFADYRTLADWYLVENRPEKVHEAQVSSWQVVNENVIYSALNQELAKYQRRGADIPAELDAEVPIKLTALLRKSQYPQNYIYLLTTYYRETKDFRLLECIPEAMLGQSAQKIYPFLEQFSSLLNTIQEEATVDRLEKHLQTLHLKAKSSVDKRALRLLEFMIERRATEQASGVGPHANLTLRALIEADKGEWAEGEPELMAQFLSAQGQLNPEILANEQIRQLKELYLKTTPGSYSQLVIGGYFANGQWVNNRQQAAINTLNNVITAYRRSNGGILPAAANSQLATYSSYLEATKNYLGAETIWLNELKQVQNSQQNYWLKQQLYRLYANALSNRATVSLGSEEALYQAVHKRILAELAERTNENQVSQYIQVLGDIWYTCDKNLHYASAKPDLISFAFEKLPAILNSYNYRSGQSMVSTISSRLHDIAGPLSAVEFLVERAEQEPRWLRLQSQDFWYQQAYQLAQYRSEAVGQTPKLQQRLLAIVLKELRKDLETRIARNRYIYQIDNSYFWAEKQREFSQTAQAVLSENVNSEETVIYVADYLYYGLKRYDDAIAALMVAYNKELLGIEGQYKLCYFLQEQHRYDLSVPILVKMVAAKPERLEFHTMLMRGYFYTDRPVLLATTLMEADSYFHAQSRWQENVIASLGNICLETKLYNASTTYYQEAIALHVKTAPNRGIGDGTLSQYYRQLAGAYSGLNMTTEAVNAAAGAIVSWGADQNNRQNELNQLETVLRNAQDLDLYVSKFNAEISSSGLENPIVRKALGKVYISKNQFAQAEAQLVRAVENQPNDTESQRLLVEVYDRQGKKDLAISQLLVATKLASHDLKLYQDLGERWTQRQKLTEAERAYTNMVEVMPNESESHAALANIRQRQNRWAEAAQEWQQVIRIRTKEPTGYLGLAESLIQLKRTSEAKKVLAEVLKTDWPSHFGDVKSHVQELENRLK